MKCLVLDTALSACSAAVTVGGDVVAGQCTLMQKGHAEALLPMIDEVLAEAALSYGDLDRLAVTVGPGAFTGLRIGLSAARGLAVALDLPLAGISSLQAVGLDAAGLKQDAMDIAVALDARRGQVFFQLFDKSGLALDEPQAISPEDAGHYLAKRPTPVSLVGSGAALLPEGSGDLSLADRVVYPDARRFAAFVCNENYPCTRGEAPRPLYLRAPDAKLPSRPSLFAHLT